METQQQTARILPFRRPAPTPDAALANALAGLNAALASQRAAVEAWRVTLGELAARTGRLGRSATELQEALAGLAVQGQRLREASRRLAGPAAS